MCESDRSRHQINPRRFFLSFVRCVVLIHLQLIHHSLLLLPGDDDDAAGPPPGSFFCTLVPCYPVFVVSLFASTTEGEQTTAQKKGPSQTDVLKTLVSLSATSAAAAATVVNCRPPLGPEETQTSEDVVYNPSHHCLHL